MPLMPKRVKFRKTHRGKRKGNATRGNYVAFGDYGLQTLEDGWITARQIEAARIGAQHYIGREGRLWVRIFPHKSVTAKPLEVRMGTGKGEPAYWCAVVKPGTILYEIGGLPEDVAREALRRASRKLSVRTRLVRRRIGQ